MKKKLTYVSVAKYVLYLAAFYLLQNSKIVTICPFPLALFAALCYLKQNVYVMTPLYILAGFLSCLSFEPVIYIAIEAIIMGGVALIYKHLKKPIKIYLFPLYVIVARSLRIISYIVAPQHMDIVSLIIETALCVIFSLAFINGLKALIIRGMRFKSTVDENMSLGLLLLALFMGVANVSLYGINIAVIIGIFLVLLASYTFGSGGGALVGAILGLSCVLSGDGMPYFVAFTVYGLVSGIFIKANRMLGCISVVLAELILSYLLKIYDSYSYLSLISVALPALLFIFVPPVCLKFVSISLGGDREEKLGKYLVGRSRFEMSKKLLEMSEVFKEMELMYLNLIFGENQGQDIVVKLANNLREMSCTDCPSNTKCLGEYGENANQSFCGLVSSGMVKGRVTLMELDRFLTGKCCKVNTVLQNANRLISMHSQGELMRKNIDNGKALTSRQMGAVSKVFKQLAEKQSRQLKYNTKLEQLIVDELCMSDVVCSEVVVLGDVREDLSVSLVLSGDELMSDNISKLLSKVLGYRMMIVDREMHEKFAIINLKPVPTIDVIVGVASGKKFGSAVSGDTHSVIKVSESQLMLCLCDGMGSGEQAQKISNAAISLVENFYVAGFDSDIILNSVNKMLAYIGGDEFAAIDILSIDLNAQKCDFIKIGSPESYFKRDNVTTEIAGSSLPLGILEDLSPWSKSVDIKKNDMIILSTDGVKECFVTSEEYFSYVNAILPLNPKQAADQILLEAQARAKGKFCDDLTVMVCKII